ncbi:hypothetical protein [Mannheimia pernigra]|uniref:Uncharacterized protein n=1 Tax=Mannheimia pernigra TaxID=111844 RepID=A0A7D5HV93_9PAST|nr:hypothetical protein [Mannheimia pernigra]QLB39550.1 hypothetical protein HV559_00875 [Mannheimia pernigra]
MNDNCAFRVYFNRIAHDKYTYDNYDRVATRSFDTDSKKEGFERVDTYHRDVYGRTVRTDNDIVGQGGDIDGYITYERDIFGRNEIEKSYSNDQLNSHTERKYDLYDRQAKRIIYDVDGKPSQTIETKYNAYNRPTEIWFDQNSNGVFDGKEGKQIYEYNPDRIHLVLSRTDIYADGREYKGKWTYDDFERRIAVHQDDNENGKIDGNEYNWQISHIGETRFMDIIREYTGTTLKVVRKVHYDNNNGAIATFRGNAEGVYHTLNYDGYDKPRSSSEDFTQEHYNELFKQVGGNLKAVNFTNDKHSTQITLDNNVLAKLTKSTPELTLAINGDATDTVKLKDYGEFTKAAETVKIGKNTYDKLTTDVEGKTYTLLVDTDIKLFDAAHPGTEII